MTELKFHCCWCEKQIKRESGFVIKRTEFQNAESKHFCSMKCIHNWSDTIDTIDEVGF